MPRLQLRRGQHAALPSAGMLAGEPLATLDRGNLHLATDATTRIPITPAVDALTTIGAVNASTDLLLIHDADAVGQREKKITVQALRAALNIADTDTDERVAAVSGGASGYLYGTDGIDGVLRMGTSMQWALDQSNAFVTLNVAIVDGGTF